MSTTGKFGGYFRTGSNSNTIEAILSALNDARGTAYSKEENSLVYAENFAIAKAIASIWNENERFSKQTDPKRMGDPYLSRWEKILNIRRSEDETLEFRKRRVAERFKLWSVSGTESDLADLLRSKLGQLFIRQVRITSSQNHGAFPGGLNLPGGVTLPDGEWFSSIAHAAIRVWQPRNKDNYKLMTDNEFYDSVNKSNSTYDNAAPAYISHDWHRFAYAMPGTISASANSNKITGTGTNFTTNNRPLKSGETVEIVDDSGTRLDFVISNIQENGFDVSPKTINSMTNCTVYVHGIVLDNGINLDNCAFDE